MELLKLLSLMLNSCGNIRFCFILVVFLCLCVCVCLGILSSAVQCTLKTIILQNHW